MNPMFHKSKTQRWRICWNAPLNHRPLSVIESNLHKTFTCCSILFFSISNLKRSYRKDVIWSIYFTSITLKREQATPSESSIIHRENMRNIRCDFSQGGSVCCILLLLSYKWNFGNKKTYKPHTSSWHCPITLKYIGPMATT